MRNLYQQQLENLNRELIKMGAECEEIIGLAAAALTDYSAALEEKTAQVGALIDESERTIENICLKLLLRQQPAARDLRQISAAMKMITDMERIGDQAEDIVDLIPKMEKSAGDDSLVLKKMAQAAKNMVTEAVDAYVKQDMALARKVMADDDIVDNFFLEMKSGIIGLISKNPDEGEFALDLLMISKYFERIGDHCTNIAEWVVFSLTGIHEECQ